MNWLKHIAGQTSVILSLSFLIGITVISFLYPYLNQSDLNNAYHQNRELAKLPPLTQVKFLKVVQNTGNPSKLDRDPFRYEPFDHFEVIGDQVLIYHDDGFQQYHIVDVCYAVSDEQLDALKGQYSGYRFIAMNGNKVRTSQRELIQQIHHEHIATKHFWMGTDQLGRDMLSRILTGGKISLSLAFLAVIFSVIFGVGVGLIAGYFGGLMDRMLTWMLGLFWAIPGVLFVVIIALVVGSAKVGVVAGISFVMWVEMAQIVKTRVKVIRKKEYVQASRMIGLSHFQLINKHILPNVIAPVFVLSASAFADALMLEAGLSFLGVGINPPNPSWGNMIRSTYGYMLTDQYAYMVLLPATMLFLVVLSAVFLSNGLKDAFELRFDRADKNRI